MRVADGVRRVNMWFVYAILAFLYAFLVGFVAAGKRIFSRGRAAGESSFIAHDAPARSSDSPY